MRKIISLLLKVAVSGVLLYFALHWVNIETMAIRLRQLNLDWFVFAVAVLLVQMILLTLRWQQIMRRCGGDLPIGRLFRFSMIGAFFNQTLPSSIGGDGMRVWLVGKQIGWRVASYSVVLDRVIGLAVLAGLVIVCLPWTFALVREPVGRSALLVIGLGSLAGWLVFLGLAWEPWRILQRWTLTRHLAATATITVGILRSPGALTAIFLPAVLVHLLTAITAWCIAQSAGADLSLTNALFLVLPVILISVVPISIAGWGVREGAMVAAFTYAGLPQSDGLIVSLLFGAAYLALGILGGLVWILRSERLDRRIKRSSEDAGQLS